MVTIPKDSSMHCSGFAFRMVGLHPSALVVESHFYNLRMPQRNTTSDQPLLTACCRLMFLIHRVGDISNTSFCELNVHMDAGLAD